MRVLVQVHLSNLFWHQFTNGSNVHTGKIHKSLRNIIFWFMVNFSKLINFEKFNNVWRLMWIKKLFDSSLWMAYKTTYSVYMGLISDVSWNLTKSLDQAESRYVLAKIFCTYINTVFDGSWKIQRAIEFWEDENSFRQIWMVLIALIVSRKNSIKKEKKTFEY